MVLQALIIFKSSVRIIDKDAYDLGMWNRVGLYQTIWQAFLKMHTVRIRVRGMVLNTVMVCVIVDVFLQVLNCIYWLQPGNFIQST